MLPTTILKEEHQVILQVLNCLEAMVRRVKAGQPLNGDHAQQAADFFRTFADQCHHGKEEAHLFPMMEAKGIPREGGPIGVMMHEHELGRACVRGMRENAAPAAAGDGAALAQFIDSAEGYINLLREHIQKEDHCLFAMADGALSDADQKTLMAQFERVENEEIGAGTHEKYLAIAQELAAAYGVEPAPAAHVHAGAGCAHHKH